MKEKNIFLKNIVNNEKIKQIINNKNNNCVISNVAYNILPLICSALSVSNQPTFIITSNNKSARHLIHNLKKYNKDLEISFLPSRDYIYYNISTQSTEISNLRVSSIIDIFLAKDEYKKNNFSNRVIVTTIDAAISNMPDKSNYEKNNISLKLNSKYNKELLYEKLIEMGYTPSSIVEGKGQVSSRGSILDVFALNYTHPIRIEFFFDEIDSIRTFDINSQRSLENINEVTINFAKEYIFSECEFERIKNDFEQKVLSKIKKSKNKNNDYEKNIYLDYEHIIEKNILPIIDKYYDIFVPNKSSVISYLENDFLVILDEPQKCINKYKQLNYENSEILKSMINKNLLMPFYTNRYLNIYDILKNISSLNNVFLEEIHSKSEITINKNIININSKNMYFFKNDISNIVSFIKNKKDYVVIFSFINEARCKYFKEELEKYEIYPKIINDISEVNDLRRIYIRI